MNKAKKLLDHLLASPLSLNRDDVMLVITNGNALSFASAENLHFKMRYEANLLISNDSGNADALLFILLQWLDANQPDHAEDAIKFEVDMLDHQRADVTINITLEEVVKVSQTATGISLTHIDDPRMEPVIIPVTLDKIYGNGVLL